jgi:hypothetical protein
MSFSARWNPSKPMITRKGQSQQGYLWAYSRPKGDVLFEWRLSRSREGPEEFLKTFEGRLQTDGYYAYESLAKERKGERTLVACWVHCRRGFHEALAESNQAAWFVRQIGLLYAVEKLLRRHGINRFDYLKELFTRLPRPRSPRSGSSRLRHGHAQTTMPRGTGSWLLDLRLFLRLHCIDFRPLTFAFGVEPRRAFRRRLAQRQC